MLEAVIFDLDGTLVDSEQYGHRVAFNDAFEAYGLPDRWTPERYRGLLATTGGERRLFAWLSSPESSFVDHPEAERRQMAKTLHRWKTDRVEAMAVAGGMPARQGAGDWLDQLEAAGVRLAVATTGSRQWAIPLLDHLFRLDRFEVVVVGDDVAQRKPEPEAYLLAMDRLALDPSAVVAVEDSGPGWEAARAAGMVCVIVANPETNLATVGGPGANGAAAVGADPDGADPDGAPLIIDGFGPSPTVIFDRFGVMNSAGGSERTTVDVLARLLARARA